MVPDAALIDRFRGDLDALSAPDERIGIAVSGGPDSLALLLLAVAARPGLVEAATVDHGLRPESQAEAEFVASVCEKLGVPHATVTARWEEKPQTALQQRAREERYRLLANWIADRRLAALVTAHHADDQAETVLMRLNRGSGLRGVAGMRSKAFIPGDNRPLLRPLLSWRRSELAAICDDARLESVSDPSNRDEQFERVRVRNALTNSSWLDVAALANSASHLASADDALSWVVEGLAHVRVTDDAQALRIDVAGLPGELQRRLLLHAFTRFHAPEPRGGDLTRALDALSRGQTVTLAGMKLEGGATWRLSRAPQRRPPE